MIEIAFWTDGGLVYEGPKLPPSEIKVFLEMVKESGVWIDGSTYKFKECQYNAGDMTFDVAVE